MEPENSAGAAPSSESGMPPEKDWKTKVFIGEKGLRAGWRLTIYIFIMGIVGLGINPLLHRVIGPPQAQPSPGGLFASEVLSFALVFGCALVMSRIEARPAGEYGLPIRSAFRGKFWAGLLLGLAEVSLLIGSIAAFGGYSFGPLALHGAEVARWGLFYLAFFLFVGFFEEFLFRGYTQFTLGDGIGFWPAALVLSLLFGAGHLGNKGEDVIGALAVVMVGLLFAFTLKRTGNLWLAVGLHAGFDWGESFLYSVPDSGLVLPGHLSNSVLHGAKWLTGGTVGPEASVFCFLTMGLQFFVVMWLFPSTNNTAAGERQVVQVKVV